MSLDPTPPIPPPPPPAPTLIAGKFADRAALEQGIHQIAKQIGYEFDTAKPLIGPGGHAADVDGAVQIYKGLERMQAMRQPTPPAPPAPPAPTPSPPKPNEKIELGVQVNDDTTVEQIVEAAGLTMDDLAAQYSQNGKLTDEQYAAIKKVNPAMSRPIVNEIARAKVAGAQQLAGMRQQLVTMTGGQAQFDNLIASAHQFLDPHEITPYQDSLNNPTTARQAMESMLFRHQQAVRSGKVQPLTGGDQTQPAGGASGAIIQSRDEYAKIANRAERGDKEAAKRLHAHHQAGGLYIPKI